MRFKKPKKILPKRGDLKRVVKRVYWPKRIGDELVWLEKVTFVYTYKYRLLDYVLCWQFTHCEELD